MNVKVQRKELLAFDINDLKGEVMPIYEYRCRKCGEISEKMQKVSEKEDSLICPSCGKGRLEKILSGFSSSKGSGSTPSCGPTGGSTRFS